MTTRGQPRLGYTRRDGRLERDPEEAGLVYALFDAIAEGRSTCEASDELGLHQKQALRVLHEREYAFGELPIVSPELYWRAHDKLARRNPRKHKGPHR